MIEHVFVGEGSSSHAGDGDPVAGDGDPVAGDGDPGAGAGDPRPGVAVGDGSAQPAAPVFEGTASSAGLVAAARRLVASDPRGWSDDECLGVLEDLERAERAVAAARMNVLLAVDARGITDTRFGHRTANWVGARHGGPVGDVKRALRDARTLALHYPVLEAAVRAGTLSPVRAGVVCRVTTDRNVDALTDAQYGILALSAAVSSFRRYADDIAAMARYADADGSDEPAPPPAASRLSMGRSGDELHLRAVLTGELGVEVEQILSAWTDRLHRHRRLEETFCPDLATPQRDQLTADALGELVRRGHTADVSRTQAPVVGITMTVTDPDPDRPWDTLPIWGSPRRLVGPVRSARHTIDCLTCDPLIHPLHVDLTGTPLTAGRTRRLANRDQRRAAATRDGGCVFPGCDAPPSWTDLHHVVHWDHDEPTDMWNLASLCRRHHGVVHRHGWTMRSLPGEHFEITTPSGLVLNGQRHGRPAAPA